MLQWIRDWALLSILLLLGMGLLFVFWAIWPMLPARLPAEIIISVDPEGVFAIGLLLVILLGLGKLITDK